MPVFVRTDRGDLRLTLYNRSEILDSQLAATPQEANRVAIMMLASRDVFEIGDMLSCRRADEDHAGGFDPDHAEIARVWDEPGRIPHGDAL
jgi:hypothetical protein